jgi:hypothetical protein
MTSDASPVVSRQPPPKIVLQVFNPLFSALLRSPAHALVDNSFLILHLTGRRSGKHYDIVVTRHELDGVLTVMTGSAWRLNTRGGAAVQVTARGTTRNGRGVLVEDADQVTDAYAAEIGRYGWKGAQRPLGLRLAGRAPTRDELRALVVREELSLIRVTLDPA